MRKTNLFERTRCRVSRNRTSRRRTNPLRTSAASAVKWAGGSTARWRKRMIQPPACRKTRSRPGLRFRNHKAGELPTSTKLVKRANSRNRFLSSDRTSNCDGMPSRTNRPTGACTAGPAAGVLSSAGKTTVCSLVRDSPNESSMSSKADCRAIWLSSMSAYAGKRSAYSLP